MMKRPSRSTLLNIRVSELFLSLKRYQPIGLLVSTYLYLKKLSNLDAFILDDFGLGNDIHSEATFLVDLLGSRQSVGVQMVTSQVGPKGWKGLFEDPVIADAVIDRIINPSHHIILKGGSYREKLTAKC